MIKHIKGSTVCYEEHELDAITAEPKKEKCAELVKDSDVIKVLNAVS